MVDCVQVVVRGRWYRWCSADGSDGGMLEEDMVGVF